MTKLKQWLTLNTAAKQAARAGDARELAAAQRREQDLTQDNSALKACLPASALFRTGSDMPAHCRLLAGCLAAVNELVQL